MAISVYSPPDNVILHKTEVDFTQRMVQRVVNIVQYDKHMPVVEVKLYLNGEPYKIPLSIENAKIRWSKRDKKFTYEDAKSNADRSSLYIFITEQMSCYPGQLNPVIELSTGNEESLNTVASSQAIPITIDRNPVQRDDIESQIEWPDLEETVMEIEDYKNQAATSATNAANSATAANTSKNQAATSATNAANSATAANTSKEQAATSATNAANSAIDAANSAEEVITTINNLPNPFYPAGESKRVGQLQEFGASLDAIQMNDWKLLECNGEFKPNGQYPELSSFLKSFVYAEQISTSPISACMYGYPIMINTNIYYVHSDFYGEGSTKIIKYNTITKTVSEIDVPKAFYNNGIAVGTKIYYVNKSEWGSADEAMPIIEFDSISETCNTITVQADYWSNPIVIGTDIYYIDAEETATPSRILKLDTVTKTGSYLPIHTNEGAELLGGTFVVNNDIYYSVYSYPDGCSYIKTNTLTGEITNITNLDNPQSYRRNPIVVGTNVYFTWVSIGSTYHFIKFNSLTQEETIIPVLEGQWSLPVLINDNIWVVSKMGNDDFIGKFNLLTNTMEKRISVKNESTTYAYHGRFVIGTDILYAKTPNVLMRFDTLNELQSNASLPPETRMYDMVSDKDSKLYSGVSFNDTITELNLYLRRSIEILPVSVSRAYEPIKINESTLLYSIQNDGSKLLRFDTKTNEGLVLDVPTPNGTNKYWRYPVLVGTNVYFTDDNSSNSSLLKVNTLTNEATKLNTLTSANVWGRSVVVGTNIYYYNGGHANVSIIGKFDTLTGVGSNITVPSNSYQLPVLLGTDIYFGSNVRSAEIKKFNTLNDTVSSITVPSLRWANPKVVGTDIYYFYGTLQSSSIGKLDTLTNIGTIIPVPLGYWEGPGVLAGSKIYSQNIRNKLLPVFDTETQTGTILTLSELTQTELKASPILIGTELYYGSSSSHIDKLVVLDTHSHDVLELPAPRSSYTNPILIGTDIYYAGDLSVPFSVRRLGFSFKLPEMTNKYIQY